MHSRQIVLTLIMLLEFFGGPIVVEAQQLMIAMENLPPAAVAFQQKEKIPSIPILYASDFDPEDDGTADESLLMQAIAKKIPDVHYQGIAVLDWEEPGFVVLENGEAQSVQFQETLKKYLRLLALCKQLRPRASWGYYGIPFTSYWDGPTVTITNERIAPLIQAVDVLLPSLYSYYPQGTPQTNNHAYFVSNTAAMAQLASVVQKKWYIFICHRFHPSNKESSLKLIPKAEIVQYLLWMKNSARHYPMAGFIWWGADDYYYKTGSAVLKNEVGNKSFKKYWGKTITSYGAIIKRQLN